MKSAYLAAAFLLASSIASASEIHNLSKFTIDWNNSSLMAQSDGLGCPGEANIVLLQVPGIYGKDFTIDGDGGDCKLVFSVAGTESSGAVSTTLIYKGQCASDNDENFTVYRKGTSQQAHITVDAGC